MKFHQLRDFVAVVEMGSVHAASRKLGISQPAVSKSIRSLEAELGIVLFDRTRQGAALNTFGRAFHSRAQLAVHELQRARDDLSQLAGHGRSTKVAFSVFGSPALTVVPGALASFRRRFPEVEVRIVEGSGHAARAGLNDGSLDFAILPLPFDDPGGDFVAETLLPNRRIVAVRAGHPQRGAASLRDLTGLEWVTTGAIDGRHREFEAPFELLGLPVPRAPTQCESLIALLALLVGSDMVTFLPPQWVESPATKGVLCRIPIRESIEGPSWGVVRRKALPLAMLAEAMSAAIAREVFHYASRDGRLSHSPA